MGRDTEMQRQQKTRICIRLPDLLEHFKREAAKTVHSEMYGPPSDCKGKVFRRRKPASMYPAFLWRVASPGHDEIRRVAVLRNPSAM